jgi:predicted permease
MNSFLQAMRSVRRSPGFAAAATLTLALGIGGSTALFSVVNAVLIRPLPFADPAKLAILWSEIPRRDIHEIGVSYSSLNQWRSQSRLLADMAIFEPAYEALAWTDGLERIATADVSGSFFEVVGVAPIAGRVFSAGDDHQGTNLAVLSFRFWSARFGGDRLAIGRSLELTGKHYRIVGVMPDGFWFPGKDVQIWTLTAANGMALSGPVVARLKRSATVEQAQAEMSAVADHLDTRVRIVPLLSQLAGKDTPRSLTILFAATISLLLIACSNVAHLVFARGASREHEFAIRAALGADRRRMIFAIVSESVVLSALAGVLGLVTAFAGIRLLPALAPAGLLRLEEADLSLKVVSFALGLSFVTWLLFGLAPALRKSLSEPAKVLRRRRTWSNPPGHRRIGGLLVVTQFALTAVLLTDAGLLLRSFLAIQAEDPGMRTDCLLSMRVYSMRLKRNDPRAPEFYRSVLARVEAVPTVDAAGVISGIFKEEASGANRLTIEGGDGPLEEELPQLTSDTVSSGFFRAAGVPLLAGRYFTDQDSPQSPPVAIINRALAARFGPGSAVGRRLQFGTLRAGRPSLTVVGVVGNIRQLGLERSPMPAVFLPLAQNPLSRMEIVVRTSQPNPIQLAPAVSSVVRAIDRTVVLYDVSGMEGRFAALTAQRRFQTWLLVAFSAVALALAGFGIFSVIHYSTVQRTHDIGIRMALGAGPSDVLGMVLGAGLRWACIGLIAGLSGALSLTWVLSSQLYGVASTDPLTLTGVSVLLVAIALLAVYLPARRATRVDPLIALRFE